MLKIKSCPCCGGSSKIHKMGNAYVVKCNECGTTSQKIYRNSGVSPCIVQNLAITNWNKRVKTQPC